MIDALLDLPANLRKQIEAALASGSLAAPYTLVALKAAMGKGGDYEATLAALSHLAQLGIEGAAARAWLQTVAKARDEVPRPELVWTGPEVSGVHSRDTSEVFREMLGSAKRSIWASTYTFFDGPKAFATLAERMDAVPDLRVTLLINIKRKFGNTSTPEALLATFSKRFWSTDWPGTRRPEVYYDPRSLGEDGKLKGVLHAKAIVADESSVLITSANFTEAALEHNIELGLKVDDQALALRVIRHYQKLIDLGLLEKILP